MSQELKDLHLNESQVVNYIGNHPFNAFSLICGRNSELNLVKDEDAKYFLKTHSHVVRIKTISAIVTGGLLGYGSYRLIGTPGVLKGLAVAYLTVAGVYVGTELGDLMTSNSQKKMADVIRSYGEWRYDPKVIEFFKKQ